MLIHFSRLTSLHANKSPLNGRSLDKRINTNAEIRISVSSLLYHTKLLVIITSQNLVSPLESMVVDSDNLMRANLISSARMQKTRMQATKLSFVPLRLNRSYLAFYIRYAIVRGLKSVCDFSPVCRYSVFGRAAHTST